MCSGLITLVASASCHGGINLVSAFLVDKWVGGGSGRGRRRKEMRE